MTDLESNILRIFDNADEDSLSTGISWYDDAHCFARDLGGNRFHRAAGVIAALSPMSGWNNNKNKAIQLYRQNGIVQWNGTKNGIGLSDSVRKAVRIFNGEDALDVLVKPKTRAFFMTIADPTGEHPVVIDRHAFDIAIGEVTNDAARQALERKGEYARFSEAYCNAASRIGIAPAQLQAITWVQWRRNLEKEWYG